MNLFFKSIGFLFLVFIVIFFLMLVVRAFFCGPDKSVEKVSFPLARAIIEHIEAKGIPDKLEKIEKLPYELVSCNQKLREHKETDYKTKKQYVRFNEKTENCTFQFDNKLSKVDFITETYRDGYIWVSINVIQENTFIHYEAEYSSKENEFSKKLSKPIIKTYRRTGICDPKFFRITD